MLNVEPKKIFTMIYNQEQRQLIIWEQKETRAIIRSFSLLINLGLRLWSRNLSRKYFGVNTANTEQAPVLLVNEQMIR